MFVLGGPDSPPMCMLALTCTCVGLLHRILTFPTSVGIVASTVIEQILLLVVSCFGAGECCH